MIRIEGTTGTDIFPGTAQSEWIYGNGGFDIVHGWLGKDIFTPGAGPESGVFQDFQDGSDLIDLSQWGVTSFDQLIVSMVEPGKLQITTADLGHKLYVQTQSETLDANDFLYVDTPVYEYSTGFDSVDVAANEYAVHLGNGGNNWLNLKNLVRGTATATEGALVKMDDDDLGNGTFTVMGVTQHFFDFQNIRGGSGKDTIYGDQQDNHFAGLANADELHGGGGNDRLFGNNGTDKLYGDTGDDLLNGGTGYDLLRGGDGSDTFVFVAFDNRRDTVFDYQDGIDQLDISQWGVSSIDDLIITPFGTDGVRVSLAGTNLGFQLYSEDGSLTVSELDNSDFIFS
ncbi:hypothetical protein FNJ84_04165 [Paracoccus sp. M683]|uniref:calcium-binding protein n=1 Tax=Paracoccus sp. M683 TaxID=2594268 RepID=UPI001180F811|nr:hypothetical protein [Paracoccus sp. M683]TRW98756.1 hypothetical protein FNJ84_04165 [Paracoccus sp. M683]